MRRTNTFCLLHTLLRVQLKTTPPYLKHTRVLTVQNNTTGNLAPHPGVGFWLFQEIYHFCQFQLGPVTSSNMFKGNTGIWSHLSLSLGLSKAHWVVSSNATGPCAATEKEKTRKEGDGEDQTLGQISKTTGFLGGKDCDIDLRAG